MKVIETKLPGLKIIEPRVFGDTRGFFFESYQEERYRKLVGIEKAFVQDNISRSTKNVLRGLHYQLKRPQDKLVTVITGEVFDVAVDIRKNSQTFGKWVGVILSDQNHRELYIPAGFAHGFLVLSNEADFHYKCTDYYVPDDEHGIAWNDPNIDIKWLLDHGEPILSAKDKIYPLLKDIPKEKLP